MRFLVIDFETRSAEPIANGAYKYTAHPSTQIICMGWAVIEIVDDSGKIYTHKELAGNCHIIHSGMWYNPHILPVNEHRLPDAVLTALDDPSIPVAAFNAEFDLGIWYVGIEDHDFPDIEDMRWYCVAAQVRAFGCPGSLDKAVRFILDNPQAAAKHKDGRMLINECSILPFNEDPGLILRVGDYCMQDVGLTVWVMMKSPRLTPTLWEDWHVNREINETGIPVNVEFAKNAQLYAKDEISQVNFKLTELTGDAITSHTQTKRIREMFCEDKVPEEIQAICTVYRKGEKKFSLSKDIRRDVLQHADDNPGCISERQEELLRLVDQATATSVSKYQKIESMAESDGRVRGAFLFAGAAQTLRYSSRGVQVHNLRRDCYNATDACRIENKMADNLTITDEKDDVMQVLAKMLRPTIKPKPGKKLVVGDWSSIEARVLPWLTGYDEAETLIGLFAKRADVYSYAALPIYNKSDVRSITPEERQIGKIATLSLGFGGGAGALMGMAKAYGVDMSESDAQRIVIAWRKSNQWAKKYWLFIDKVIFILRAVGGDFSAGRIRILKPVHSEFGKAYSRAIELPCGTRLHYHHLNTWYDEEFNRTKLAYAKPTYTARQDAQQWPRQNMWYGIICENVTQATAASLLREKLRRLRQMRKKGWPFKIIGHCHDEIILECDSCAAEKVRDLLKTEMETVPVWAKGLPLAAEVKVMDRYGK